MEFSEYQFNAVKTAVYGEGRKIIYPALGLGNEAGEVLGKIKKCLRDGEGEFTEEWRQKIADEMGDVLWYLAALSRDIEIPLEDIALSNLAKLADRKERGVIQGSGDKR